MIYVVSTLMNRRQMRQVLIEYFFHLSVRPEKPIIKVFETGESVEGYLGPYQIGTSLSLVCQVNGGKLLFFNKIRNYIWYLLS